LGKTIENRKRQYGNNLLLYGKQAVILSSMKNKETGSV